MQAPVIIVIGTSTGGLSALQTIAAGLPATLPAAVCVVQHIDGHQSFLPALLDQAGPLKATAAKEGDPIEPARIYVAPPDHHLLVGVGHLHLTRGPRENFVRPAADPLFRSASGVYGPRAIGVILTGNLSDGTAGLWEIKRRGGVAVVQYPNEAEAPGMPRNALDHVDVDHCVPVAAMPQLLIDLATRLEKLPPPAPLQPRKDAESIPALAGQPTMTLTCPECGGAMKPTDLGTMIQFDCHIGHSVTSESMASGQFAEMEKSLESALRRMNERSELCRLLSEKAVAAGEVQQATEWTQARQQTDERLNVVRSLLESEWVRPRS